VSIWDRFKKAKENVAAIGTAQVAPEEPAAAGADAMQGYSEIWASELIDDETCKNCAAHDGHEYASMAEALVDYPEGQYPAGGYKHCTSDSGCRGTLAMTIRST
jgi:hypothetical protein